MGCARSGRNEIWGSDENRGSRESSASVWTPARTALTPSPPTTDVLMSGTRASGTFRRTRGAHTRPAHFLSLLMTRTRSGGVLPGLQGPCESRTCLPDKPVLEGPQLTAARPALGGGAPGPRPSGCRGSCLPWAVPRALSPAGWPEEPHPLGLGWQTARRCPLCSAQPWLQPRTPSLPSWPWHPRHTDPRGLVSAAASEPCPPPATCLASLLLSPDPSPHRDRLRPRAGTAQDHSLGLL